MNFNKNKSSLVLISIFTIFLSSAQSIENKIDKILNTEYAKNGTGGIALVSKKGEIIYNKAFGLASLELETPMTEDMVFEIGSLTKQFTAIAILMLMEQGKLNLSDDIKKYIPSYPTQKHTITIHNLLNHTSGLKNYVTLETWYPQIRKDFTPRAFIDLFKDEPLSFAPGEKWEYNNSGYYLLGYIIEKVSGQSYENFIQTNIFEPLEMNSSLYASHSNIIKNRARGYSKKNDSVINAPYLSYSHLYSAGALMSTAQDLFKWNHALNTNQLISNESKKLIYKNTTLNDGSVTNYSYGWAINIIDDSNTIEHSGGTFGYATYATYLPKEDVFVTVLSNCDCKEPRVVTTKIAAICIDKPMPSNESAIRLNSSDLNKLVGTYTFEDNSTRIITLKENQLFFNFPDGNKSKLFSLDGTTFWIDGTTESLTFIESTKGMDCLFKNRIYESKGSR